MRCYGKILGLDNTGRPAAWLVELDNDGTPLLDFTLIPCETLPDIVPIWTITYPIGAEVGTAFTTDETSKLALQLMRRAPMRK
jgi:hypothetical protein